MSDTQQARSTDANLSSVGSGTARQRSADRAGRSGWAGWVLFGGLMLLTVGGFQAIMGLVALFNDEYFLVTNNGLLVTVDYTTWGWVHLVLGAVACAAGAGVMLGNTWAQVVGIILAIVSVLVNIGFLPAYPIWSTMVITLDVIVIYAIAVHGREVRDSHPQDA
jgi:hypothetical protein